MDNLSLSVLAIPYLIVTECRLNMVIVNIISQLDKERGENLEKVFNFIATKFVHQ